MSVTSPIGTSVAGCPSPTPCSAITSTGIVFSAGAASTAAELLLIARDHATPRARRRTNDPNWMSRLTARHRGSFLPEAPERVGHEGFISPCAPYVTRPFWDPHSTP